MVREGQYDHGVAPAGANPTPEQTAAVYAAMMEELGIARKDALPLEDKKGTGGRVDLNALDRDKKANDPRTAEFRIVQKNAAALSAWKNMVFDDVDEADLELDNMNSGQSHRERMKAGLEASRSTRGGYATRGGRGGQLARGGGSHSTSRYADSGNRGSGVQDRVDIKKLLAQLGGRVPQKRGDSGIRKAPRGGFAKPKERQDDTTTPESELSFTDKRSVNALLRLGRNVSDKGTLVPDRRSREPQSAPKAPKPNKYNQGFALASPEDFLARSWAAKSRDDAFSHDKKDEFTLDRSLDQAQKPRMVVNNTSENDARNIPASEAPSTPLNKPQSLSERAAPGGRVGRSNDIAHSAPVEVRHEFGGNAMVIGFGTVYIKTVNQNPDVAKIIQIEVLGKTFLEQPLVDSFEFSLDLCTITFYSDTKEHQTKWILTASQPEIASSFAEALKRFQPGSSLIISTDAPAKDHADKLAIVEDEESLISFSDDPTPLQAVSQFTEDLFSLMGNQFIEDAVKAINGKIEGSSAGKTVSDDRDICEVEGARNRRKEYCGLATSRYAKDVEVGDFLNKSAVFQNLPDSTAAFIKEKVNQRVSENARKDASDQELSETANQQPRKEYSVETLISLRNQVSSAGESAALESCVESSPKEESRTLFSYSELIDVTSKNASSITSETPVQSSLRLMHLGEPLVSGRETTRKPLGLAGSKYAGHETATAFQETRTPNEQEPSASKLAQESLSSKKPEPRVVKPVQGLSSSIYADGQGTDALFREPLSTKKLERHSATQKNELFSSKTHPSHPITEFKSFLKSQENQRPGPKPFQGPASSQSISPAVVNTYQGQAISEPSNNPQVKSVERVSNSDYSEPVSSNSLQKYSTTGHPKHTVKKPTQGLASSRYANPRAAEHGTIKINMSTTSQNSLQNPAVISTRPIPNVAVADPERAKVTKSGTVAQACAAVPPIFLMSTDSKESKEPGGEAADSKSSTTHVVDDQPLASKSGAWNTWRRRDSFNSHDSKESNETAKPLTPRPTVEPLQAYAAPLPFPRAAFRHQSILSGDSSASCESFETAIEETNTTGKPVSAKNHGLLDQKRSGLSEAASASSFKSFDCPMVPPQRPHIRGQAGLMSSRYATAAENITHARTKPEPRNSLAKLSNQVGRGPVTEKLAPSPFPKAGELSACPQVLKPTATQFTPSFGRSLITATPNSPPSVMNTFSTSTQPIMATVMVEDPQRPGTFMEVRGILKLGETPIVGYIGGQNSQIEEIMALGDAIGNTVSPQRAPSTPIIQKSKNVADTQQGKQQEIQDRLTQSLTQRRPSQSPSSDGV